MTGKRKFRFKLIVAEDDAETVLDAIGDMLDKLKIRREFNDITMEEVTTADDPTRLPGIGF